MIALLDRALDLAAKAAHVRSFWRELRGLLKQLQSLGIALLVVAHKRQVGSREPGTLEVTGSVGFRLST